MTIVGVCTVCLSALTRERKKSLRLVTLADIVEIFGIVGSDYPSMLKAKFNESQGDYDVVLDSRWTARQPYHTEEHWDEKSDATDCRKCRRTAAPHAK
jgi:hypothetical protein